MELFSLSVFSKIYITNKICYCYSNNDFQTHVRINKCLLIIQMSLHSIRQGTGTIFNDTFNT